MNTFFFHIQCMVLCLMLFLPCVGYAESVAKPEKDMLGRPSLHDSARVAVLSDQIRNADQEKNAAEVFKILREVSENIKIDDKDVSIVKYSDAEIQVAMVDLLFKLWGKYEKNFNDPWFGGGEDTDPVLPCFQMLAESTFSERLYKDSICRPSRTGYEPTPFTLTYLSHVNTSETLRLILHSQYERISEYAHCLLYSEENKKQKLVFNVSNTMRLLSLFRETAPEILKQNRKAILAFMASTFAYTEKYPTELSGQDYDARFYALDVLDFYENSDDAPFVQQIADNALIAKVKLKNPKPEFQAKLKAKFEALRAKLLEKKAAGTPAVQPAQP